ncbi:MAG: hypothetical protein Q4G58_06270 [bacterium]|nr:hypothetical protein [bacterium]
MNRKYIKYIFIVLLLFISVSTVGFVNYKYTKKVPITKFFENDANKITEIQITNGNTGNVEIITDKNQIEKLSQFLSTIKLQKNSKESSGWLYALEFYSNDTKLIEIVDMGSRYSINGEKYTVISSNNTSLNEIIDEMLY